MKIDETFSVALNAIKANKSRTFLTMLGIIIGVAAVILLVSIGSGLQQYITKEFEDLGTNLIMVMPGQMRFEDEGGREGGPPGVSSNKLTLKVVDKLERGEYVQDVLPIVTKSVVAKYGNQSHSTGLTASTEKYLTIRKQEVAEGRNFSKAEVAGGKKVAILGPSLKQEIFGEAEALGKKILLGDQRYTIVGIFTAKGAAMGQDQDDMVLIPLNAGMKQFNLEKLNYLYVVSPSAEDTVRTQKEVEHILLREMEEDDFTIYDSEELLATISSILSVLTAGLAGIAGISLLVGGIGIMNIMLVSVTERTREIGLRKSVGATSHDILLQFLIEAIFLSLVGGSLGIALGIGGSVILGQFLSTAVTWWSVLVAFSVSALVGIVFGVAPAYKASKLDPINALRYE
jgi:putative ABC transport system permease protein